jgi:hypothetical protein
MGSPDAFALRLGPSIVLLKGARFALEDRRSLLPSFVVEAEPDFRVDVRAGATPRDAWRLSRVEHVAVEDTAVSMRVTEWDAEIRLADREARVHTLGPWAGAVDSFLKTLVQLLALHDGTGALFHASSVVMEGRGYLFVGRSGAGKTTVADLSEAVGGVVLSEEMSCVSSVPSDGRVDLLSLPLHHRRRREVVPYRVPLAGVFELVQASTCEVSRLGQGDGVRALMRTVTTGVRDPRFLTRAFDMVREVAGLTSVASLRFRKDASFWEAIRAAERSAWPAR